MVTRYVNTGSTAGGDGTTNDTAGATRAYASLSEWEAARQASLAEAEEAVCSGATADATAVTIDGWTTTATNYVLIRGNPDDTNGRHAGVWSTSKYRLEPSGTGTTLSILEQYVRVTGILISRPATSGRGVNVSAATGSTDIIFDGLLIKGATSDGITVAYNGTVTIRNCVIYGLGVNANGIYVSDNLVTVATDNCTVSGGLYGCLSTTATKWTARNCYAGNTSTADYSGVNTLTTCVSEDGTQSTTTAAYSISSGAYFTNITAGSEDFRLQASSTLIDVGTDLSASFTTDASGATRSGTWDVGALEYSAAFVAIDNLRGIGRGVSRGVMRRTA